MRTPRLFHIGIHMAFLVVGLAGFGPSYVWPLLTGAREFDALVHVHAAIMFGWLLLGLVQAWLAGTGRLRLHMRLGAAGIWLFPVLMVTSVLASVRGFLAPLPPEIDRLLDNIFFLQLCAFVLAPVLFALGMRSRRRAVEDHKRYMTLLTFFLLEAAASRMTWLPGMADPDSFLLAQNLWLDLLLVPIVVHDLLTHRRIVRGNRIGLTILLVYQTIAVFVWNSAWWLATANRLEAWWGG